jgi:hypothetical protein
VIDQLRFGMNPEPIQDLSQTRFHVRGIAPHHGDTQHGVVTHILVIHLCDGDIVMVAQPILYTSNHPAFIFEGVGAPDQEGKL